MNLVVENILLNVTGLSDQQQITILQDIFTRQTKKTIEEHSWKLFIFCEKIIRIIVISYAAVNIYSQN